MYRLLSNTCSGGPCPTLYLDDETGAVGVQGYVMDAPVPMPSGEDMVRIPAEPWARLLAGLPTRMLLTALFQRSVRVRMLSGSR